MVQLEIQHTVRLARRASVNPPNSPAASWVILRTRVALDRKEAATARRRAKIDDHMGSDAQAM